MRLAHLANIILVVEYVVLYIFYSCQKGVLVYRSGQYEESSRSSIVATAELLQL